MLDSLIPQPARGASVVADDAARLLLAGELERARALLEETPAASALVLERALAIASSFAARGDVDAFLRASHRIVELAWGADAERTADIIAALAESALSLGQPNACARLVSRAKQAATVLAIRHDDARLSRLARLAERAIAQSGRGSADG